MSGQCYRVRDSIVLRDEHRLLGRGTYLAADPPRRTGWHLSQDEFGLLTHLLTPRDEAELENFRKSLPTSSSLAGREDFSKALDNLERLGIVAQTTDKASHPHSIYIAPEGSSWRYPPASAPVSVALRLPMAQDLFVRLMAECDALGVLQVEIPGDDGALEFVAQAAQTGALKRLRSIFCISLSLHAPTDQNKKHLLALTAKGNGAVRLLLDPQTGGKTVEPTAEFLKGEGIAYSIRYRLRSSDELADLAEVAHIAASEKAESVKFVVDPDNAGSLPMGLATAEAKIGLLRQVKESNPEGNVRLHARHVPIAPPAVHDEPRVKELLTGFPEGCVVGKIGGFDPFLSQSAKSWVPTDRASPLRDRELPPNCCQAGLTHLAVDRDGTVYPCEEAMGMPELAMGSLATTSLAEIWASPRWHFFRGGWDLHQLSGCYWCRLYIGCAARRCRVYALKTLGNRFAPQPVCLRSAADLGLAHSNLSALLGEGWASPTLSRSCPESRKEE